MGLCFIETNKTTYNDNVYGVYQYEKVF